MSIINDHLFISTAADSWTRIERSAYKSEAELQELIARLPEVLENSEIGGDVPARFMLVTREAGIPDAEYSGSRWSVDHLLLDQKGIPTLVEVKRSTDTRIRREVIGQLLEYAANAELYWPVGTIRAMALKRHGSEEALLNALGRLLGSDDALLEQETMDNFWSAVEDHLKSGRIRLLFVADALPSELKRIIEFLNAKMNDVEVLGVELCFYKSGEFAAVVPKVVGQTEITRGRKSGARTTIPTIDREKLLAATPVELRATVSNILDRATDGGMQVYWGVKGFSLRALDADGVAHSIFYCFPSGSKDEERSYVEGYLPPGIRTNRIGEDFRQMLSKLPDIQCRGLYTYCLYFDADTQSHALLVLHAALEIAREISGERLSESNSVIEHTLTTPDAIP